MEGAVGTLLLVLAAWLRPPGPWVLGSPRERPRAPGRQRETLSGHSPVPQRPLICFQIQQVFVSTCCACTQLEATLCGPHDKHRSAEREELVGVPGASPGPLHLPALQPPPCLQAHIYACSGPVLLADLLSRASWTAQLYPTAPRGPPGPLEFTVCSQDQPHGVLLCVHSPRPASRGLNDGL